jgi:hypothetical protein
MNNINCLFDALTPDEVQKERMYRNILVKNENNTGVARNKQASRIRPAIRKPLAACIVLVLCLTFSIPVLAANVPAFYHIMFAISPSAAQFFMPVRMAHENNGIRMEVESAYISGSTAEFIITMQDLTSNRIDASIDLFDSYRINSSSPLSSAGILFADFNEETGIARFHIGIHEYYDINTDKITFTVGRFISGQHRYDGIPVDIDLSGISTTPEIMPMPTEHGFGYGGRSEIVETFDFDNYDVLVPSSSIDFGVEGITITAIGFVDNKLRIQMNIGDNASANNRGWFFFKDENGNEIEELYGVSFSVFIDGERTSFVEDVFDISPSELNSLSMFGTFISSGEFVEGPWQVTFPLE